MLNKIKYININKFIIFIISLLICASFYLVEGLIGIDKFYHPDSLHYLTSNNFPLLHVDPKNLTDYLSWGYYYLVRLLNYNYELNIFFNFFLYSITNVLIYEKIFKKYIYKYNNLNLILLIYLLFLDPYRLHLACHVLKETVLIFLLVMFLLSNIIYLKVASLLLLEFFRKNSFIYFLVFLRYKLFIVLFKYLKQSLSTKLNKIYFIFLMIFAVIIFFLNFDITNIFSKIDWTLKHLHYREFPSRDYDFIDTFQKGKYANPSNFFYEALFLKISSWTLMILSGSFAAFTNSILFQILGVIILFNHMIVYKLSKKTFIDIGLIFLIICIAIYSNSYTAFYRYCYIGFYLALINFFYKYDLNEK